MNGKEKEQQRRAVCLCGRRVRGTECCGKLQAERVAHKDRAACAAQLHICTPDTCLLIVKRKNKVFELYLALSLPPQQRVSDAS